jgi:hypothetical protein
MFSGLGPYFLWQRHQSKKILGNVNPLEFNAEYEFPLSRIWELQWQQHCSLQESALYSTHQHLLKITLSDCPLFAVKVFNLKFIPKSGYQFFGFVCVRSTVTERPKTSRLGHDCRSRADSGTVGVPGLQAIMLPQSRHGVTWIPGEWRSASGQCALPGILKIPGSSSNPARRRAPGCQPPFKFPRSMPSSPSVE